MTKRVLAYAIMLCLLFTMVPTALAAEYNCAVDGHVWETVSTLKEADCVNGVKGVVKQVCKVCEASQYASVEGHVYGSEPSVIGPTCEMPESTANVCLLCGAVDMASVKPVPGGAAQLDHDPVLVKTTTKATCLQEGVGDYKCSMCGLEFKDAPIPTLDHVPDTRDMPKDCDKGARTEVYCTVCETVLETLYVDGEEGFGHQWEGYTQPGNCVEKSIRGKKCSVCDLFIADTSESAEVGPEDPNNHKAPKLMATLREPTCQKAGVGKYFCEACKAEYYSAIPADHVWDEGTVTKEATCGEAGEIKFTCTICKETKTETITATGKHEYEDTIRPATCTTGELAGSFCKVCQRQEPGTTTTPVEGGEAALGHDWVPDDKDSVLPTCLEEGKGSFHCSRCPEKATAEQIKPEHDLKAEELLPADCNNPERIAQVCKVCKGEFNVKEVEGGQEKLGHQPVEFDEPATCVSYAEFGMKCDVCGEILESHKGSDYDPNNHAQLKLVATLRAPTCEKAGVGKYVCEAEGCDYEGYGTIDPDHVWDKGVVTKEPNCGEEGEITFTCTIHPDAHKYESIPVVGEHKFEEGVRPADCLNPELVGSFCKVCGQIEDGTEPQPAPDGEPALDHDWVPADKDSKMPTCTELGEGNFKCSRCEATADAAEVGLAKHDTEEKLLPADCNNPERIAQVCKVCKNEFDVKVVEGGEPALEHKNMEEYSAPATCVNPAITGYKCPDCGEVFNFSSANPSVTPVLNPNNHEKPVLVSELRAATCDKAGVGKYHCDACKKDYYAAIPAEHVWDEGVVTKEPNCGEEGEITFTCTIHPEEHKYEPIPVVGEHQFEEIIRPADCTTPEMIGSFCKVCGEPDPEAPEAIEVPGGEKELGHDWVPDDEDSVLPTCTEEGTGSFHCSRCPEKITAEVLGTLDHDTEEKLLPADCLNNERIAQVCKVCKGEFDVEDVAGGEKALEHDIDDVEETTIEANCQDVEKKGYICKRCGELVVTTVGSDTNSANHAEPELLSTLREPTCDKSGVGKYKCKACGVEYYSAIAAEHVWNEGEVIKAATCGENGKIKYTCTIHPDVTVEKPIPATGEHKWTEGIRPATCTEPEKVGTYCEICGAADGVLQDFAGAKPATGHDYEVLEVEEEPTCAKVGKGKAVCKICGAETTEIPKTEHDLDVKRLPADCILNERDVVFCTVCEEVFSSTDVVGGDKAPGKHGKTIVNSYPANCSSVAREEYVCTVCNQVIETVYDNGTAIDPNTHTYDELVSVLAEPDCKTQKNGVGVYLCTGCKEAKQYKAIPFEHTYGDDLVSADGTFIYHKCTVCGVIEIVEELDGYKACLKGGEHKFVDVEATETMTAGKKCSVCGLILEGCEEITAECKHENVETLAAVEATCTETGLTEGKKCKDCGETLVAQETVAAKGHTEEEIPAVEATCTETGLTAGVKCSVCNEILFAQETVAALGHDEVVIPAKEATCAEAGNTEGKKCNRCGVVTVAPETIEALAHTEEAVAGKAATCTEDGLTDGVKCSVCGAEIVKQEVIKAKGHTEVVVAGKAATCTEAGLTDGKTCSVCNAVIEAQTEIAALGHDEVVVPGKAATCNEDGLTEGKKCNRCGEITVAQEAIKAAGHSYTKSYDFNDDYTMKVVTYTCSKCGHTYTELENL